MVIFFNETFRISHCELDKHVGLLGIYFGTIKKNTFLSVPPLGYQGIRDTGGYKTDTISTIISRIISLYRGNEFAIF